MSILDIYKLSELSYDQIVRSLNIAIRFLKHPAYVRTFKQFLETKKETNLTGELI